MFGLGTILEFSSSSTSKNIVNAESLFFEAWYVPNMYGCNTTLQIRHRLSKQEDMDKYR